MTGRGRRAVLPPADHRTEPPLAPDELVVTVVNKAGYEMPFDFAELPVAELMQRSLARVFAARSAGWNSHMTAQASWITVKAFARFVSELEHPPEDLGDLTTLFGPSTERLCHLTPEHLKFDDTHAHLVLGRHPVLLPPRLAELLRQLAEQPQLRPQLSRVHPGPRWLFPGMVPGKPISTHGMTQKLGRHGIPVRTARNAALAALAADLPSPILADVTGMHRHTALRWVAYARRDWAEYLAARAEDEANKRERKENGGSSVSAGHC
ncbi:hypothetical protein [Streptomyces lydicus]|uniref:hypothetical protein n=1 Tax=Streptomyces lydicus TaxID=47763 RepID=UPI0037A8893E